MSQLVEESPAPPRQKRRPRLRPRTRRGWIVAALVAALVLGGGGFAAWWFLGRSETPQTITRTVTIEPTTLKRTLSAAGTLEPARAADLTFAGSGTVTAVNVAVGDAVTAGEALAAIDPAALQIALDSAKADLTAAQQTLADLEDSGASTAAIRSATATVQVKRNAVTQARSDLSTATLTAPYDPVSAVTLTGTNTGTVTLVEGATTTVQQVRLGVRGATRVEITEGLSAGQSVQLADMNVALRTSSGTGSGRVRSGGSSLGGLGGGFTGGQPPLGMPPR